MYTLATQLVSLYKLYFPAVNNEEGQGMVEYALIIALIALAIVAAFATGITEGIGTLLTRITDAFAAPS